MKKCVFYAGAVILVLIGIFFVLSFYGVTFINARLKSVIGPEVVVSEIKIRLTHLSVKGIRYEDPQSKKSLLSIEEIRIYPALLSSLKGALRIRDLTLLRPSFFISRSREGIWVGPWPAGKKRKENEAGEAKEKKEVKTSSLRIDRIRIQEGAIDFEDRKVEGSPAEIRMRKLECDVKDIQYPFSPGHSPIALKGKIKGPTKEGDVDAKGWIDFDSFDMETVFKVQGVELKAFEPYYRKRVSAEIESGDLHMEAKINVKKKMIDAPGELELTDLRIREGGGSALWIPATTLVSLLRDKGNRIKVHFEVKGNMDDPQFSLQEDLMRRIAISLAGALGIPIKVVGEELFKGVFKGTKGLAEGLRSLEDLFRPKQEKK